MIPAPHEAGTVCVEGGFGLYVHWPFCAAKCPYCDFNSHVRASVDHPRWARALTRELTTIAALLDRAPVLDSIFLGGGTPSLMAPETVSAVIASAENLFPFADDIEITLEANPTSSERAKFAAFHAAGVNRVSLGVQSLQDEALRFLGRRHTAKEALGAIGAAQSVFERVSFDLIYARPDQSAPTWRRELAAALALEADHMSLYQLTIEEGTRFHQLEQAGHLAPLQDDPSAELYEITQEMTVAAGLPAYEISNHARPGGESRHNLVYWRGGAWIGIGPGAHGRLPAAGGRIATETARGPEAWLEAVERAGHGLVLREAVAAGDQGAEYLLMGLRLAEGIDLARAAAMSADLIDERRLADLVCGGFLAREGTRLKATPMGRPVLNRLIEELLAR